MRITLTLLEAAQIQAIAGHEVVLAKVFRDAIVASTTGGLANALLGVFGGKSLLVTAI